MAPLSTILRKRITIEEPVETSDLGGGFITTWEDYATVWASVEPLRGRESVLDAQLASVVMHKVIIRYLEGVTAKMRINVSDRYLNIRSVINKGERNEQMELLVEEGVAI